MSARSLRWTCSALLLAGLAAAGLMRASFSRPMVAWAEEAPPKQEQVAGSVPVAGASKGRISLDISGLVSRLRSHSRLDQNDQLRDWAVFGTLASLGVTKDVVAQATHDIAPIRTPYLDELFAYDYGPGRRAILSDDEVIIWLDSDDKDPTLTLGRVADRVRMEMGAIPGHFRVFSIRPDPAKGRIEVENHGSVEGNRVFSRAYGYFETSVRDVEGFSQWLSSVDDVSYVNAANSNAPRFGGRRGTCQHTANVTPEDVAALYAGQQALQAQEGQWEEKANQLCRRFAADARALGFATAPGCNAVLRAKGGELVEGQQDLGGAQNMAWKDLLDGAFERAESKTRLLKLESKLRRDVAALPGTGELGFSLDPQWDEVGLARTINSFAADPCSMFADAERLQKTMTSAVLVPDAMLQLPRLASELSKVKGAMPQLPSACARLRAADAPWRKSVALSLPGPGRPSEESAAAFHKLRAKPPPGLEGALVADLAKYAGARDRRQCARYDGQIRGTRVGMILFYTDLLAKLWVGVDYHHTAPVLQTGIVSMPRMYLEEAWVQEGLDSPSTRLWFGPKREAYSKTLVDGSTTLLFQHIATRVFAAGSNPANPGKAETKPAETSRRALGWWDRHFARVANFEQQYHQQNQIMKWSVITALLLEQHAGEFLREISFKNDLTFDTWLAQQENLRYRYPIQLLPRSQWVNGQECMNMLSSYSFTNGTSREWSISGGVSLGGRHTVREASQVEITKPAALRHQTASEGTELAAVERAWPKYVREAETEVVAKVGTRARTGASELGLTKVSVKHELADAGRLIRLSTGDHEIGRLVATTSGTDVRLTWVPREAEAALDAAKTWSAHRLPASRTSPVLISDERTLLLSPVSGGPPIRVQGGPPGRDGAKALATSRPGWFGLINEARADVAEAAAFENAFAKAKWQRLDAPSKGDLPEQVMRVLGNVEPTRGGSIGELRLEGLPGAPNGLTVLVDAKGGIYFPKPEGPARQAWAKLDVEVALTPRDLKTLRDAAHAGKTSVSIAELSGPEIDAAARALEDGDPVALLKAAPDPARRQAVEAAAENRLLARGDLAISEGDGARARSLYARYRSVTGRELPLRQALVELRDGSPENAASKLQVAAGGGGKKPPPDIPGDDFERLFNNDDRDIRRLFLANDEGRKRPDTRVRIEVDGADVVTALHLNELERASRQGVSGEEMARLRQGVAKGEAIYLNDRISFSRVDPEVDPGETLAELFALPDVKVAKLQTLSDIYDPGLIVDKKTGERFRRLTPVEEAGGRRSTQPLYLVSRTKDDPRAVPVPAEESCPLQL